MTFQSVGRRATARAPESREYADRNTDESPTSGVLPRSASADQIYSGDSTPQ